MMARTGHNNITEGWLTSNMERESLIEGFHADIGELQDSWFLCHWLKKKSSLWAACSSFFCSRSDHSHGFEMLGWIK